MTSINGTLATSKTKSKIYLATPCYGGLVSTAYLTSLWALQKTLALKNYDFYFKLRSGESLISRGRNSLVADFLGRKDCDYLLFIDADIQFQAQDIIKLIEYEQPVTAMRVPLKGLNWQAAFDKRQQFNSPQEMEAAATYYNVNIQAEDKLPLNIDAQGFAEVEMVGTACMLIKREAFDILREKMPDAHYINDIATYETEYAKDNFWTFFDTMIHPVSRRYLSEDFAFCYRWRHYAGGKVYVYMHPNLSHIGSYQYRSFAP